MGKVFIFYGGNGSGKTTVLNVIAERLGLTRDTLYNRTNFYSDYLGFCESTSYVVIPEVSRIITSDDAFKVHSKTFESTTE